jgi:V8-like Glu-specific endopeptidase
MTKSNLLFVALSVLVSSHAMAVAPSRVKVIYGVDNRVDANASSSASFRELAKSTAAMFTDGDARRGLFSDTINLKGDSLADSGVCASERFAYQKSGALCSGFLVSPTTLVTAGHCIQDMKDCKKHKWVFDYKVDSERQFDVSVSKDSVYKCKSIINQKLTKTNDFAYIELDRPVTDRQPLKIRRSGKPAVGDDLVVIGHPSGLPTKIADGAKVRTLKGDFFVANLDTFGGNSGSAVFNVKTEEVEGILVRGDEDYVRRPGTNCKMPFKCKDDACRGEDVTYIGNVGIQ